MGGTKPQYMSKSNSSFCLESLIQTVNSVNIHYCRLNSAPLMLTEIQCLISAGPQESVLPASFYNIKQTSLHVHE